MKSVFDKKTREELIYRINMLNESSTAQWGKMNVYQMIKHCRLWEEMILGRKKYKQAFIGRLFGKMALKGLIKDDKPMMRNAPTIRDFKVNGTGDVSSEKAKWITLIGEHEQFSNPDFVHPFFGKMKKDEIGYLAFKHADHHLRQFNC